MLAAVMARAWRMRGSALGGCGGGGGGCIETRFILERRSLLDTGRLAVWGFFDEYNSTKTGRTNFPFSASYIHNRFTFDGILSFYQLNSCNNGYFFPQFLC